MRLTLTFVLLLLCISAQAELIYEKSLTLSGHNPEKWGLKHIKTELSDGYFKFNELIDIKTTTEKMSQKKYTRNLNLILKLEKNLLKNSKSDTLTCNRKLIVESKQKLKSLVTHSFCLDSLSAKDLATITKTIQQLKN